MMTIAMVLEEKALLSKSLTREQKNSLVNYVYENLSKALSCELRAS